MALIDIPVFFFGGCFGGALVWHFKTWFSSFWTSAEAIAAKLKAEAAAIETKAAAVKAAVK